MPPEAKDVFGSGALSPEIGRRIIIADPDMGGRCRRCLYRVGLYTFTLGWYTQCPNCLKDRIEELVAEGASLDGELRFTYGSVCREVAGQDATSLGQLTVEMPEFYRCARCNRLIQAKDARYHFPRGEHSSPPFCEACHAFLAGSEEGNA